MLRNIGWFVLGYGYNKQIPAKATDFSILSLNRYADTLYIKDMIDAYYVNVFRDSAGNTHYSTEEFAVNQTALSGFTEALEDAYHFAVLGNWQYVCTLHNDTAISARMRRDLFVIENARFIVENHGKIPDNYLAEELQEEAENLCADATHINYITNKS